MLEKRYSVPLILAIWVIITQMFCNTDSYLFAPFDQNDSSWFFMAGKSLMNGLLPYRDFADSKGIFLWTIYGIGYLLAKYSYVGVFWLMCLNVWATLFISYSTIRLWFEKKEALVMVLLMTVLLSYWNFFSEPKCEIFSWTAISFSLHVLCCQLENKRLSMWHYAFVGVGFVACLLTKWSIAVMMIGFIASITWMSVCVQKDRKAPCFIVLGMILMAAPYAIFFQYNGITDDFIREYFYNTLETVMEPLDETLTLYGHEWILFFTSRKVIFLFYVISALILWERKRWFCTALPALSLLLFLAIGVHHDLGHYLWMMSPLSVFFVIICFNIAHRLSFRLPVLTALAIAGICYDAWGTIRYTGVFCTESEDIENCMAASYVMSTIPEPKVISDSNMGSGLALGDALPGTRYWCGQLDATEEMIRHRHDGIASGEADFIIMRTRSSITNEGWDITEYGYHELCETKLGVVYTKHDLKMPATLAKVSPWDVITKKSYKEIYSSQE